MQPNMLHGKWELLYVLFLQNRMGYVFDMLVVVVEDVDPRLVLDLWPLAIRQIEFFSL